MPWADDPLFIITYYYVFLRHYYVIITSLFIITYYYLLLHPYYIIIMMSIIGKNGQEYVIISKLIVIIRNNRSWERATSAFAAHCRSVSHIIHGGHQRLQCWLFPYKKYFGYNQEDLVFTRPPGVELFMLSPEHVWYGPTAFEAPFHSICPY